MEKVAYEVLKVNINQVVDALNRLTNNCVEYRKAEFPAEDTKATNDFTEEYSINKSKEVIALGELINLAKYYRNSLIKYSKEPLQNLQEALSVTAKKAGD